MWPIHENRSLTRPAQHCVQGLTACHEASHASVRQGVSPKVVLPGMGFRITICLSQRPLPPVKAQLYWCLAVRRLILRWIIADLPSGLPTVKELSNLSPNISTVEGNHREGIELGHIRSINIATSEPSCHSGPSSSSGSKTLIDKTIHPNTQASRPCIERIPAVQSSTFQYSSTISIISSSFDLRALHRSPRHLPPENPCAAPTWPPSHLSIHHIAT